jgi:photosystem II stability/assembly factor-like uncharacterized protein
LFSVSPLEEMDMNCRVLTAVLLVLLPAQALAGKVLVGVGYPGTQTMNGVIGLSKDGGKTFKDVWFQDKMNDALYKVRYFPELKKFVAVGRVGVLTSADGENWKAAKLPKVATVSPLRDVAFGGGYMAAVGEGTNIIYSNDGGETWTHPLQNAKGEMDGQKYSSFGEPWGSGNGRIRYLSVIYVDGKFLATGSDCRFLRFTVSDSGFKYVDSNVVHAGASDEGSVLLADGKKLVIVGKPTFSSEDQGGTWKENRGIKGTWLTAGLFDSGTWLVGDKYGDFMYSSDVAKWEKAKYERRQPSMPITGITRADGRYVAVEYTDNEIIESKDGKTWTKATFKVQSEDPKLTMSFYDIAFVDLK